MKCILCLLEKAESLEHVFPLAVGGVLTTERVCRNCNSHLGDHVDCKLINHLFIAMRRNQLRLTGNSGRVPDAMAELMKDATLAADPTQRVRVVTNAAGQLDLTLLYNAKVRDLVDGREEHTITLSPADIDKLPTIFQRARKRAGLATLTEKELEDAIAAAVLNKGSFADSTLRATPQIDIMGYKLGILKIAYELAHRWLGDDWLDDPVAHELRDVILERREMETATLRGQIHIGVIAPLTPWSHDPHAHIGFLSRLNNRLTVSIRVFDVFSGLVTVSHDAPRYRLAHGLEHSPFVMIDPVAKTLTEGTLLDELRHAGAAAFNAASGGVDLI